MNRTTLWMLCTSAALAGVCVYLYYRHRELEQKLHRAFYRLTVLEDVTGITQVVEAQKQPLSRSVSSSVRPVNIPETIREDDPKEPSIISETSEDLQRQIQQLQNELGDDYEKELFAEPLDEDIEHSPAVSTDQKTKNQSMSEFEELDDVEFGMADHEHEQLSRRLDQVDVNIDENFEKQLDNLSQQSGDQDIAMAVRIEVLSTTWQVKDLKELCKQNGLALKGTKTELIRRLLKKDPNCLSSPLSSERTLESSLSLAEQ